jgi:hypothetical protein
MACSARATKSYIHDWIAQIPGLGELRSGAAVVITGRKTNSDPWLDSWVDAAVGSPFVGDGFNFVVILGEPDDDLDWDDKDRKLWKFALACAQMGRCG